MRVSIGIELHQCCTHKGRDRGTLAKHLFSESCSKLCRPSTSLLHQTMCVGKNKCVIETKSLNQPDPCSGHHKRVAVVATGCSAVAPPKRKPTTSFVSSTGGGTLSYCNRQDAGLDGQPFVQNASSGPLVSASNVCSSLLRSFLHTASHLT